MLLARVAEQLYWAGRYVERAEVTARVVNEHTHLLVDLPTSVPLTWEPLLAVPGLRREFDEAYPAPDEPHVVAFLLADRDNPVSVLSTVMAARTNVRTAREVLPREAWQAINDLYLYVTSHHTDGVGRRSRGRFLDKVIGEIQRFAGIVSATMCRDDAYHFLLLGRHIERADMASRVLDVRAVALLDGPDLTTVDGATRDDGADVPIVHDEVQWAAVLRTLSGLQAYYRRGLAPVSGHATVDFLLCDPDFPGSIRHCLDEVIGVLTDLPHADASRTATRSTLRTLDRLATAPLDQLHPGLVGLQVAIAAVHEQIEASYFPPAPEPSPPAEPSASALASASAVQAASATVPGSTAEMADRSE
ncbi:MAG TPA: alpha-E domain-containing protein [Acidimicrobiales bacterium]|jgi:uncharacterized alpha-E superfamily protein|nr:alpha-E domain-containing protein [Acidimicrobiales bacterium]